MVALLLMRRRRFKFENATMAQGVETINLRCLRTREQHQVINPRLSDDEMAQVQEEVFHVLGWK